MFTSLRACDSVVLSVQAVGRSNGFEHQQLTRHALEAGLASQRATTATMTAHLPFIAAYDRAGHHALVRDHMTGSVNDDAPEVVLFWVYNEATIISELLQVDGTLAALLLNIFSVQSRPVHGTCGPEKNSRRYDWKYHVRTFWSCHHARDQASFVDSGRTNTSIGVFTSYRSDDRCDTQLFNRAATLKH